MLPQHMVVRTKKDHQQGRLIAEALEFWTASISTGFWSVDARSTWRALAWSRNSNTESSRFSSPPRLPSGFGFSCPEKFTRGKSKNKQQKQRKAEVKVKDNLKKSSQIYRGRLLHLLKLVTPTPDETHSGLMRD